MTDYVILEATTEDPQNWQAAGVVSARSASAAIREGARTEESAVYVAVPRRSWKPVTVTVETKTTLKFQ